MRVTTSRRFIWLVLAPLACDCGALATAQSVPPALQACRAETNDQLRLQCYDREIGKLSSPPAATAATAPTAAAPTPSQFGFTNTEAKAAEQHVSVITAHQQEQKQTLSARVVALSAEPHGVFSVTLDNGQVWRQLETDGTGIAVGDDVTIKPGLLGSYLLVGPHSWSTKVHRLK